MKYTPDDASSHEYEMKHGCKKGAVEPCISRFDAEAKRKLYGFRPIPAGGNPVTNELVNKLREEEGF